MKRPLLISGFMGTGKSTVSRLVATRSGRPLVDLDQTIEAQTKKSVARIFSEDGEPAFRAHERRVLEALLSDYRERFEAAPVVSLGGGTLLDRDLRLRALENAVVITLEASPEEIGRRVREDTERPLLGARVSLESIRSLLEQRQGAYAEAHARLDAEHASPEELVEQVIENWSRDAVAVPAGRASYVVEIGEGLAAERLPRVVGSASATLLVTDTTVGSLHGAPIREALEGLGVPTSSVELTPGEEHKNLPGLTRILEAAFEGSIDRRSVLVGLGGGVVTDMTGFAAASWMRGVRWVGLPTTLLSMVDASVGGKTAVDFRSAKNSVGAFWQPSSVLCDVTTLRTESDRAYRGALSEVVKTGLIGDETLFSLLEERSEAVLERDPEIVSEVVERCVRVKAAVVARDEREGGLRAVLNLGHTIGHALESRGGYTELTHGEAVSLGLVAALRLGERLGETPTELTKRTLSLLEVLGLPRRLERPALEEASALLGHDKKRAGSQIRFVVARGVGDVVTRNVSLDDLVRWTPQLAD